MQYPYENLNDEEFEALVIRVCVDLFGIGCKTFSTGKDGGRDSSFDGKAENYPSKVKPWEGKFIIQAKHTKELNASCSDNDFSVNQTSILNKEINRLKEIQKQEKIDNYILFTNRKLTGGAHPVIVEKLKTGLTLQNADIIGREELDAHLTNFPHIANQFGLYKFNTPLRFYEKEIREVILVFSLQSQKISKEASESINSFRVIDKEKKNELNNLSKDYFEFIKSHSIQYFEEIDRFLKDPQNHKYTDMYIRTISDLQAKIILEREKYNDFMQLIEHLVEFIVESNSSELKELRNIVRVFIHFMYFNCDIGKSE